MKAKSNCNWKVYDDWCLTSKENHYIGYVEKGMEKLGYWGPEVLWGRENLKWRSKLLRDCERIIR